MRFVPGEVDTSMLNPERAEPVTAEFMERLAAATAPLGRLAQAVEIARVVLFLALDEAS
jgi:NAD(P)-dependent dehydrogenase (short-subunit alcohol dehydrogenase family)